MVVMMNHVLGQVNGLVLLFVLRVWVGMRLPEPVPGGSE